MSKIVLQIAHDDLSHVFEAHGITSIEVSLLSLTASRRRDRETGGAF